MSLAARGCVVAAVSAAAFFCDSTPARSTNVDYAATLSEAVSLLENNQHAQAQQALARALAVDRNEPYGLLTAATVALHTGDSKRATSLLRRAQEADPKNPLIFLGFGLAKLLQNDRAGAVPYASVYPNLSLYLRVLAKDTTVATELATVTENEPDPLRLQLAGVAALQAGESERGVSLLKALLARHEWAPCEESKAVCLPFAEGRMAEGNVAPVEPLSIPEPPATAPLLTGRATLTPGKLPRGTAMVSYAVPGTYTATTNNAPFLATWNTSRCANGIYTLIITCLNATGSPLAETKHLVRVSNTDAAPAPRLSAEQASELHDRLTRLLIPRPSRKAAHYALALQAVKRGESSEALAQIESVVAIDPSYRSAYVTLKQYNQKYVGIGNGYWRGRTDEKLVAFTFDDGPNPLPEKTPALLKTLRDEGVKATFFVVGSRAEAYPELVRAIDRDGHELANHSYTHPNLTFLSADAVRKELCRTSVVVRDLTGKRPRFYRPPGGNFNGATADAASALGMHGAYWTVDAYKFENAPFTADDVTNYVLKKVRPGSIILLHNAPANTIQALPAIFRALREQGYEFTTMRELVDRSQPLPKPKKP